MQTFGLNYDVKPGRVEEFKKTLMQLIDTMQGVEALFGRSTTQFDDDLLELEDKGAICRLRSIGCL
jgi:hypothetical protein